MGAILLAGILLAQLLAVGFRAAAAENYAILLPLNKTGPQQGYAHSATKLAHKAANY